MQTPICIPTAVKYIAANINNRRCENEEGKSQKSQRPTRHGDNHNENAYP